MREVNHRAKNMLSVVDSICSADADAYQYGCPTEGLWAGRRLD
jgi:hypothetical protein